MNSIRFSLSVWTAILCIGAGCAKPSPQLPPPVAMPVTVATPLTREVQDYEEFTGFAEGSQSVEVRARVSGYLEKIHFTPGTFVKVGDPLFTIDSRPYRAALDLANAQLEQAKARLNRLKLDLTRVENLAARDAAAQQDLDRARGDFSEATAAIRAAEAIINQNQLNVEFTEIKSPISGLISREMITTGNLVTADTTLLTTIVAYDPIYVYYDIDERIVLRILQLIREGTFKSARENRVPIQMALADSKGFPFEGWVNFVDNRLDPATGSMRIRGEFANPVGPNGFISVSPGMFTRVRLAMGPRYEALLLPQRAITSDQGQKTVFVVNDKNQVESRPIELGQLSEDGMQIIKRGISTKERVVISGLQRVRVGAEVAPNLVTLPSMATSSPSQGTEGEGSSLPEAPSQNAVTASSPSTESAE